MNENVVTETPMSTHEPTTVTSCSCKHKRSIRYSHRLANQFFVCLFWLLEFKFFAVLPILFNIFLLFFYSINQSHSLSNLTHFFVRIQFTEYSAQSSLFPSFKNISEAMIFKI